MAHISHRVFFWIIFSVGLAGFSFAFIYQIPSLQLALQGIIEWAVPIGMGMLIIGGTGLVVTSKRQMKKKLKQMDEYLGEDDVVENGSEGQVGGRFADYLTSPEQASAVYMFFIVGVLLGTWGFFMFFSWLRGLFL